MTDHATLVDESTAVLAHHGRSFSLASHFLPRSARGDAAVLYAFCRLADDLVDEATDEDAARRDIANLRAELVGEQQPRDLVVAVQRILQPVGISPALDLIDGVIGDLDFVAPADDEALHRYCYQVAGTVGLMMCAVLGVDDTDAWPRAIDLGLGMQLSNICRDVLEDAERARVYLPADRLAAAGTDAASVIDGTAPREAIVTVVGDLLDQADRFYASGRLGYPAIPARSRVAIAMAARLYQGIGHRLRASGADPMLGRTIVPGWRKGLLLMRGLADLTVGPPFVPTGSGRFIHRPTEASER